MIWHFYEKKKTLEIKVNCNRMTVHRPVKNEEDLKCQKLCCLSANIIKNGTARTETLCETIKKPLL